jgi:hypothetical protein
MAQSEIKEPSLAEGAEQENFISVKTDTDCLVVEYLKTRKTADIKRFVCHHITPAVKGLSKDDALWMISFIDALRGVEMENWETSIWNSLRVIAEKSI